MQMIFGQQESSGRPWFRRRPSLAVLVASLLFALIFAVRLLSGNSRDAISMLFVLPVALLAMTGGLRAGAVGGVIAVALVATWVTVTQTHLTALGWTSRAVPLLLVGVLLGDASDRLRRAEIGRRQLEAAALMHRQAIEINDSLVQGMAAAKWAMEAGRTAAAIEALDDTLVRGNRLVSTLLRDADMGIDGGREVTALGSHPSLGR
jgi:K+-sensing histidine kinase KdpD